MPPEPLVERTSLRLEPNPKRVLLRPFVPSLVVKPNARADGESRVIRIFARIMALDDAEVDAELERVLEEFGNRHQKIRDIFTRRFRQVADALPLHRPPGEARELLLGSYLTSEYSLESAALFNPSIVPHPDQSDAPEGGLRFVLSLRATGEGHISSVTFRTGTLAADGGIRLDEVTRFVVEPEPVPARTYEKALFSRRLADMDVERHLATELLAPLGDRFQLRELEERYRGIVNRHSDDPLGPAGEKAVMLAQSNYSVAFASDTTLAERILFPYAPSESNGIEDARFVRFVEDDGAVRYYATYTAYNGNVALSQIVETEDFRHFHFSTLNGPAVRNKGLALFPRKIGGRYFMLGRQDSENIHLMSSDHPHFWYDHHVLIRPSEPWEFVQLGNCGSPIETPAGWLVLTHGVGAMRKYSLGAVLLDLDDPSRVLGRLRAPLLGPQEDEREGYVPNVVYSCGGLVHGDRLVLPYAVSDSATRFAFVHLPRLLDRLTDDG